MKLIRLWRQHRETLRRAQQTQLAIEVAQYLTDDVVAAVVVAVREEMQPPRFELTPTDVGFHDRVHLETVATATVIHADGTRRTVPAAGEQLPGEHDRVEFGDWLRRGDGA